MVSPIFELELRKPFLKQIDREFTGLLKMPLGISQTHQGATLSQAVCVFQVLRFLRDLFSSGFSPERSEPGGQIHGGSTEVQKSVERNLVVIMLVLGLFRSARNKK